MDGAEPSPWQEKSWKVGKMWMEVGNQGKRGETFCALKTCCFAIQMQSRNRTANSFNVLKKKNLPVVISFISSLGHKMGKVYLPVYFQTTGEETQMFH